MANVKIIDSVALDAHLKTIADAVRERTGGTEELAFPNGMANAISGIGEGMTAVASDIYAGKTAYVNGETITGTMPTVSPQTPTISVDTTTGAITATKASEGTGYIVGAEKTAKKNMIVLGASSYTPGTTNRTIKAGRFLIGDQTIKGDANLVAGNIRDGVTIFGVAGTMDPNSAVKPEQDRAIDLDFSDSDIQVENPDSGYVFSSVTINKPTTLISSNIKSGVTIAGVTGNSNVVDTSAGDAKASEILSGKKAYVDGALVTGTMSTVSPQIPTISVSSGGLVTASKASEGTGYIVGAAKSATKQLDVQAAQTITPGTSDKTIAAGTYLTGTQTIKGDADFVAGNIKKNVDIFGVTGTYEGELPPVLGQWTISNSTHNSGDNWFTSMTFDTNINGTLYAKYSANTTDAIKGTFTRIKLAPPYVYFYNGSTTLLSAYAMLWTSSDYVYLDFGDTAVTNATISNWLKTYGKPGKIPGYILDTDLTASNIKSGVEVLGVVGTYSGNVEETPYDVTKVGNNYGFTQNGSWWINEPGESSFSMSHAKVSFTLSSPKFVRVLFSISQDNADGLAQCVFSRLSSSASTDYALSTNINGVDDTSSKSTCVHRQLTKPNRMDLIRCVDYGAVTSGTRHFECKFRHDYTGSMKFRVEFSDTPFPQNFHQLAANETFLFDREVGSSFYQQALSEYTSDEFTLPLSKIYVYEDGYANGAEDSDSGNRVITDKSYVTFRDSGASLSVYFDSSGSGTSYDTQPPGGGSWPKFRGLVLSESVVVPDFVYVYLLEVSNQWERLTSLDCD